MRFYSDRGGAGHHNRFSFHTAQPRIPQERTVKKRNTVKHMVKTSYDLWFDSKQVDEESIMKIVYSSGVVLN